ncbi:universal stress protein [Spirillospora albida]|uniref:universal stress protein n=1 Tax=Spirillospora albida TaxID=58123 RepID=UPI0004C1391F|nr:universal stress protein [Spirillospora albida]
MTILIAFDGSDDAQAAIEFAARHLRPEPAVILTVWEPLLSRITWASPLAATAPMVGIPETGDTLPEELHAKRLAEQGADLARAAGLADVRAVAARGDGPVWATITDAVEQLDASIVVTGSRGLGGARSVLLGSVSTRVLHHVHRPTLIVPPAGKPKD